MAKATRCYPPWNVARGSANTRGSCLPPTPPPPPPTVDNVIWWQHGNWKVEKRRKLICRARLGGNCGDRSAWEEERERESRSMSDRGLGGGTDSFHWLWGKASVVNGWRRHLSRQWTPGVYSHVTTSVTRYKYTFLACILSLCSLPLAPSAAKHFQKHVLAICACLRSSLAPARSVLALSQLC